MPRAILSLHVDSYDSYDVAIEFYCRTIGLFAVDVDTWLLPTLRRVSLKYVGAPIPLFLEVIVSREVEPEVIVHRKVEPVDPARRRGLFKLFRNWSRRRSQPGPVQPGPARRVFALELPCGDLDRVRGRLEAAGYPAALHFGPLGEWVATVDPFGNELFLTNQAEFCDDDLEDPDDGG